MVALISGDERTEDIGGFPGVKCIMPSAARGRMGKTKVAECRAQKNN